jgi:hypothetical protein
MSANILIALAVACRDVDVRNVKALIIGPFESPYEFGFFEVRTVLRRASSFLPLTCLASSPASSTRVSQK